MNTDKINEIGFLDIAINPNLDLIKEIEQLKKEKNAVILGHYYQIPEIQDISDFIGDSLVLAQKAAETKADMIVFAGVHFMAETAKILNPQKKVVLPDLKAGCSLADSAPADKFREFKKQYPNHKVISYINCTAELKTMTDIVCTSSNAINIVNSLPINEKIIFAPDRNLGAYINSQTGRNMVLWDGSCEVHDILRTEAVFKLKTEHPNAKLIAHPECQPQILEIADFIGSTSKLLDFTMKDSAKQFIVATETGILHQMKKNSPQKEFFIVPSEDTCNCNDCPYMKLNTLKKLYLCMKYELPEILLDDSIIEQAKKPVERMLEISRNIKNV